METPRPYPKILPGGGRDPTTPRIAAYARLRFCGRCRNPELTIYGYDAAYFWQCQSCN